MDIPESSKIILERGTIKIRVIRSGMYQQITFSVKKIKLGNIEYIELFSDRLIDISELKRIAEELKIPVAAQNGTAFPEGKSVEDFKISEITETEKLDKNTENNENVSEQK
ncbi:MAG: hypothetical protein QXD23_00850 [Candidatus Micrarchaeaceae archaeon]